MSNNETLHQLQAPFTAIGADGQVYPAHKWKVQTTKGGVAVCVPYLDANQVINRLNEVFGLDGWSNTLIETSDSGMICEITAIVGGKEVTKSNVGTPSEYEKQKGQASDAIKRAARNFGIGAYLNDIENVTLKLSGRFAADGKGNALRTGAELTSYINQLHPLRAKLSEIYRAVGKSAGLDNEFQKIWEALK